MNMIICGKDCEKCKFYTLNENDGVKIKIHCEVKNKNFYWGQRIPCEYKEKK